MSEQFSDLFEQTSGAKTLYPGMLITAEVIYVDEDAVMVDAGLKSNSVVSTAEFKNGEGELEVKVGDQVELIIESLEDGYGDSRLSREKAKRAEVWRMLEDAYEHTKPVKGIITERVKGGFSVDISSIKGFLPGSLVDSRPVRDPDHLVGKEFEFKLIKMDRKRSNIVVSRKAMVQEESAESRVLLESLEEGQEVNGIVKNITEYGAFLDLGGVDGLLHITDLSWKRVNHPSEVLSVGDEMPVKILKIDREKRRVSLGIKQLGEDPWQNIARRYPVNTKLTGHVTNLTDYGCFVELEEGIEGLVHMSEMDWTNKNIHPSKIVSVGDEVEVMVLEIDQDRRRISLGIKQCQSNPWQAFSEKHELGEHIKGTIRSITDFGIFIGLDGQIDGLIHLSDISWSVPGEQAILQYKKNQEIEAVILAVDGERERIALGIKQLESNPCEGYLTKHPVGSSVTGTVLEVEMKHALIDLGDDARGHLKASDFSNERVNDLNKFLHVGDEVDANIIGMDSSKGAYVALSTKETATGSQASKSYSTAPNDMNTGTTLGDLLKEQMEGKKSKPDED